MSGDRPLVSAVIPTYGRSDSLREAVESVLEQSYDRIELVVVDDASPEPVEAALSDLDGSRVESIEWRRHAQNRGANAARNTGIEAASGRFVAFLDDDDRWRPSKIERQVETLRRSPDTVGAVYTWGRIEWPDRTVINSPTWRGDVRDALLAGENLGQFSSLLVERSLFEQVGLLDERFPIWQDREFFFRLARACHFEVVREPLTVRRRGYGDQISRRYERKRDVAYPLFVAKHGPVVRASGWRRSRLFLSSLRFSVGKTALECGRFREARRWFFRAALAYPLRRDAQLYFLSTLGGETTYRPVSSLRRSVSRVVGSLTPFR